MSATTAIVVIMALIAAPFVLAAICAFGAYPPEPQDE